MKTVLKLVLLVLCLSFLTSKIHQLKHIGQLNNLANDLDSIQPGDVLELQTISFVGKTVPVKIKGLKGTKEAPIIIRPVPGRSAVFKGDKLKLKPEEAFVRFEDLSYVNIEGPIVIKNSAGRCLEIVNSNDVNVQELQVFNCSYQGIIVSGERIEVKKSEIYDTALSNKERVLDKSYPAVSSIASIQDGKRFMSTEIAFEQNYIHDNYGEGIYLSFCSYCRINLNNVVNSFSVGIIADSSQFTEINQNIIRVNTTNFDTRDGVSDCIALSNENSNEEDDDFTIENSKDFWIMNNLLISCGMGIGYYESGSEKTYTNIKIFHNTMWNIHFEPLRFLQEPSEEHEEKAKKKGQKPSESRGNQIINNVIYFKDPKAKYEDFVVDNERWDYVSNVEIREGDNPSKFFFDQYGFKFEDKCDYNSRSVDDRCFYPLFYSPLEQTGQKILISGNDLFNCKRENKVSIGCFQSIHDCRSPLTLWDKLKLHSNGEWEKIEKSLEIKKDGESSEETIKTKEDSGAKDTKEPAKEKKEEEAQDSLIKSVVITTQKHTKYGREVYIIGKGEAIGDWNVLKAKKMTWTKNDVWKVTFTPEEAKQISEFKFIVKCNNDSCDVEWGKASNHKFTYVIYNMLLKKGALRGNNVNFDKKTGELNVNYVFDNK